MFCWKIPCGEGGESERKYHRRLWGNQAKTEERKEHTESRRTEVWEVKDDESEEKNSYRGSRRLVGGGRVLKEFIANLCSR